ncbi:hypothetical protein KKG37_00750 [Patescibacteria group bacterium]|nr:hypothetical protein [Patescibacteria group bacterium]
MEKEEKGIPYDRWPSIHNGNEKKSINEEEDKKGFMKKLKQALPLANVDWGDYCDTNPLRLF